MATLMAVLSDVPDLVLERVCKHLSLRERARAELVCKRWLACSRSSTLLWGRVEWELRDPAAETKALEWLAARPGVTPREASLQLRIPQGWVVDIALDCLAAWGPGLRALELTIGDFFPSSALWAPGLSHLTQLHLRLKLFASAADVAFVAGLRSLRTLDWGVSVYEDDWEKGLPEVPAPPQLEHLCVYGPGWWLPAQLVAMTRLQTLYLCGADFVDLDLALERGLPPSLTCLALGGNILDALPACLSSLTNLQYLSLPSVRTGAAPAAQACTAQALRCLTRLEYLRLGKCCMEALPPRSQLARPPPLRALAIDGNKCALTDAAWLFTLESLTCNWHQLPDPELSAMAPRLQEVALVGHGWHNKVAGDVAARGLVSMRAMPALKVAGFDLSGFERTEAAEAALEALSQAKPQLEVGYDVDNWRPPTVTAWPDLDARFVLGAPA